MKHYRILFISLIVSLIISCKPSTKDAIKYSDGIVEQQILVNEQVSKLLDSYDTYVADEMDEAYSNAQNQLNKSIKYVNKLKGFEEDAYFKEGALVFLNTYKDVLENEHKRIIELLKLPEDAYGSKEVQEVEQHRNESNKKIDEAFEKMLAVQKKFAKKYNISMDEAQ